MLGCGPEGGGGGGGGGGTHGIWVIRCQYKYGGGGGIKVPDKRCSVFTVT